MALSIHTNYSALTTQTNLNKTNAKLATNQQRLGTGYRVNSAADDAAGLQIATRLDAQSRGMAVATRNVNDSVSLLQTAEGAFSEMTDIVQRMKDLATEGANGTATTEDLTAMKAEFDDLALELENITTNTKFGGQALLGAAGKLGAGGIDGGGFALLAAPDAELRLLAVEGIATSHHGFAGGPAGQCLAGVMQRTRWRIVITRVLGQQGGTRQQGAEYRQRNGAGGAGQVGHGLSPGRWRIDGGRPSRRTNRRSAGIVRPAQIRKRPPCVIMRAHGRRHQRSR